MTQFMKPSKHSSLPMNDKPEIVSPALSKSVMSMKFMKRKEDEKSQVKETKAHLEKLQVGDWFASDVSTKGTSASSGKVTLVRDYTDLYAALPGRRSFNGCNKAVEKYYYSIVSDKYEEKRQETSNKDVIDDEEMVQRYQELVSLPRGPGQGRKPVHSQNRDNGKDGKDNNKKRKQEENEFIKLNQGFQHGGSKKKQKKN
eukprot:gene31605-38197_t